jgi:hypothetical protein
LKTIVSDYQYFPSVTIVSALTNVKHIHFDSYETYQKGGFRNRCEVLGANGVVQLIIPLAGGRTQKGLISEVKIDYREDWPKSHFRTLLSCYNRSAFFEYYRDGLERIFQSRTTWLVDWNMACFEWLLSALKLDVQVGKTGAFKKEYASAEYWDLRGVLNPANRNLPGIKPVQYSQVFEQEGRFIAGLSVLDLLFCEGPGATIILQQMVQESI